MIRSFLTPPSRSGTPAARAADALIARRLAAFKLGQRDHDALFGPDDRTTFQAQIGDAIEALRNLCAIRSFNP